PPCPSLFPYTTLFRSWSVVILVLVGVLMAVPPSVSQLDGAGRHERIGPLFRQAVWLALALGVLLFTMVSMTGPLLAGMGIAEEVDRKSTRLNSSHVKI